jgi:2-polyprenyl-6-methoxyphenol hydroxylase-like FAD-dependent oxidoreductase
VREPHIAIVGGGIAGGALATVLARAGTSVLMLERQPRYRDHVRGEILWPWGVRLARQLGIEPALLDAGARVVRWLDVFDEGAAPTRNDVGEFIDGVDGSLNIAHPRACAALATAAAAAGADVHHGVRDVHVTAGKKPLLRWVDRSGREQETHCRLIVGADGRRSSVRSQSGIAWEVDAPAQLIAGVLADEIEGLDEDANVIARESDLLFFSFPQGGGRARLYLCFPTPERSRFAGPEGAERFLHACGLRCLDGVAGWAVARRAGPCATFPGEDSRASHPIADGIVLIGDAAGYENPLEGQGLSMGLQDVHDVAAALLSGASMHEFDAYAANRARRQRLANLGVALQVWANDGFAAQDPESRAARFAHIRGDDVLSALELSFATGFEALPQDLTHADLTARLEPRRV